MLGEDGCFSFLSYLEKLSLPLHYPYIFSTNVPNVLLHYTIDLDEKGRDWIGKIVVRKEKSRERG